jgi:hypothetical protein
MSAVGNDCAVGINPTVNRPDVMDDVGTATKLVPVFVSAVEIAIYYDGCVKCY